jgi:hypothetical protein
VLFGGLVAIGCGHEGEVESVNANLVSPAGTTGSIASSIDGASPPVFSVISHGGKCLDFSLVRRENNVPKLAHANACAGTIDQQITVFEVDSKHHVLLRVNGQAVTVVPGTLPAPSPFPVPLPDMKLELQPELSPGSPDAWKQTFALDGDSIMLASDRTRVIKIQNNRGANRSPVVLGYRELADAEFWTFASNDGMNRKPTSGFVRVPEEKSLIPAVTEAGWGSVIEISPTVSINVPADFVLFLNSGVTIRGGRRNGIPGATIFKNYRQEPVNGHWEPRGADLFNIQSDGRGTITDVRVTGLRIQGPSDTSTGELCVGEWPLRYCFNSNPEMRAIRMINTGARINIDHNEVFNWPVAGVSVTDGRTFPSKQSECLITAGVRASNVTIARNFIHHSRRRSLGYGVSVGGGAFPLIQGNTFSSNRHAIGANPIGGTGYRAIENISLNADPPEQYDLIFGQTYTHDFDMHGTGDNGMGGFGGDFIEVARNLFLGSEWGRDGFDLRGDPCVRPDVHHNVSVKEADDAFVCSQAIIQSAEACMNVHDNIYETNPTKKLGVGDFDRDGTEDLFMATGAAWFYAPHGRAEWRFLAAQTDTIDNLRFGDFDADGRTDVFTQQGRDWLVSWGGASAWQKINESAPALADLRVGYFDSEPRADVFFSDGQRWWISTAGIGPLTAGHVSNLRAKDLGFGDFNGDGMTDVVGVVDGFWKVSLSAKQGWDAWVLRPALTTTMAGLVIADFNGGGVADIATYTVSAAPSTSQYRLEWKVSWSGKKAWEPLKSFLGGPAIGVGRFNAAAGADILYWQGFTDKSNHIHVVPQGSGAPARHSLHQMR